MTGRSHGSAYLSQKLLDAHDRDVNRDHLPAGLAGSARPNRGAFVPAEDASREEPLGACRRPVGRRQPLPSGRVRRPRFHPAMDRTRGRFGVSQRLHKVSLTASRRAWIERYGAVPASVPVWPSRESWIETVRAWAESPAFRAVCAALGVLMSPATLVAVAVVMAEAADHSKGRNMTATKAFIAARVGCSDETVKRAWRVLAAAGWAIKVREGHGSPSTPSVGNRAAIWHLISRPQPAPESPLESAPTSSAAAASDTTSHPRPHGAAVENVPLPPLGGSCSQTRFENNSPSAHKRALDTEKSPQHNRRRAPGRCWRTTPRPLALQRLAAGLVTPVVIPGRDDRGRRSPLIVGLDRVHIGTVCDALARAAIDPHVWTAQALRAALDADMRATGWVWPNRIERPGAFLAWRLRRLQARHADNHTEKGGSCAAARPDKNQAAPPRAPKRYQPSPPLVLTGAQRARIAAIQAQARQQLAKARHNRTTATKNDRPATSRPTPTVPASTPDRCAKCGAPDPTYRPYMPARLAHLCDTCWDAMG